uniref:Putative H-N-H homing endonuclease n=1 Tax=Gloeotilopsis planctonica TaxID=34157 RepID=A0A1B2RZ93_9CHLO|nr:putative H-N-H homing endonuclease [Gloeotilopsis planctonica]
MNSNYDIYQQFIEHLKNLEKQLGIFSLKKIKKINLQLKTLPSLQKSCNLNLEKHHIIPFHCGGLKNGPIVFCTPQNHVLAHYYRYLAYRQKGDLVAFTMRQNQKINSRTRALLGVEIHKKNKTNFYNSAWQAEQGKKGGKKTGRNNGLLTRQGEVMRETLKRTTYWDCFYSISNQNQFLVQKKIFFSALPIKPQKTFTDLVNFLRLVSPTEIKDVSSLAKVARGQRLSSYGWQLVAVDIDWDLVN